MHDGRDKYYQNNHFMTQKLKIINTTKLQNKLKADNK